MNAEPPVCNIYGEGERARREKLYQTRGYNGVKKSLHSNGQIEYARSRKKETKTGGQFFKGLSRTHLDVT